VALSALAWLNLHCQKQRESDYAQNCSADYYLFHRDATTPGADLAFLHQRKAPPKRGVEGPSIEVDAQ